MVFTTIRFEKHLWKSEILSKDEDDDPHLYLKCHSSTGVFPHFGGKNQPPGLSIIVTLVENGLNNLQRKPMIANKKNNLSQSFLVRSNEKLHLQNVTNLLILH